ncbi:MAG TPA: cytochrome b [Sphingomicrobium sp.]|nr:cytochrome b [Sphingomicrobium sp.]
MADRDAFDTATRIAAGDVGRNYDDVAVALHWATAILVVVQFLLAITWDYFPKATTEQMQTLHISLGVLLTTVIVARIVWRLVPGHRRPAIVGGWVKLASKGVHYLLYVLLVAQVSLGFAWRWAQGHDVGFFGLFAIPGPYGALARPTRHILAQFHQYIGWTIVIVAFGHALAAFYHYYFLKDRVLGRMLPAAR